MKLTRLYDKNGRAVCVQQLTVGADGTLYKLTVYYRRHVNFNQLWERAEEPEKVALDSPGSPL